MLLRKGSKGDDVRQLQEKLGLDADGIFGSGTESAVKKWQSENGLEPDGIVGEGTWSKLFGEKQIIAEPRINRSEDVPPAERLKGHVPEIVLEQIHDTIYKFGINTPLRLAHFLAQCSHESMGFKITSENLNYSVQGLKKIFPRYFPGNLAESYAKNPEKIASKVYGGRMGNGPESTKEGFKFRGRGYIQLTGKDNYSAFSRSINEDCVSNPDLVSTKYPLLSAAWFFQRCLSKCDTGASDAAVASVTRCVNGGTMGLQDRIKEFKHFYKILV